MAKKKHNPMKLDGDILALSLLTLGESMHSFSAFLPSRFTVRNWVLDGDDKTVDKNISNLRSGYAPSIAISLALGGVISYIAKSPLPFIFAAGSSVAMTYLYEQGLPKEKQLHNCLLNGGLKIAGDQAPAVVAIATDFI